MNTGTILLQPAPARRLRTGGARRGSSPCHTAAAARRAVYAPAYTPGRTGGCRDALPQSFGGIAAPRTARLTRRKKRARRHAVRRLLAVWVTRGYEQPRFSNFSWVLPNGSRYTPYANLHCVVLAGRAEDGLLRIADPLEGWQTVEPEVFWQSFEAMGGRAVAIE